MAHHETPALLPGIEQLAMSGKYDVWILDQFGVLHDGKKAYPKAVEAVEQLARVGVKLLLLSNSSRPPKVTKDKLPSLGFDPHSFADVITSGGLTHKALLQRDDPWFRDLGRKVLHMTWTSRGGVSLEGLGLELVDSVEEADFLLAHGTEGVAKRDGTVEAATMQRLESILGRAAELAMERGRNIPLVVANPDFVTVEERALRVMPGTLGKFYKSLGGFVKCMGKPDPIVFDECCRVTGAPRSRVVMIGDSLHHDIQGAAQSGIDSIFVCAGIHANDLGLDGVDSLPDADTLRQLLEKEGSWPTYAVSSLRW